MKLNVIILIAAMASSGAMANPVTVSTTGTLTGQNTLTTSGNNETLTTSSENLSNGSLYGTISNAVANAGNYGSGLTSTNLPANGYIAFDPNLSDGTVNGIFYVTNKDGLYYPLSGLDGNGNYYSYVELDTYYNDPNNDVGSVDFGFADPSNSFNGVATEKFNTSNGNGTANVTVPAVFYIHDNPYAYNAEMNTSIFYSNQNAMTLNGNANIQLTYQSGNISNVGVSLSGSGVADVNGQGGLANGQVSFGENQSTQPVHTGTGSGPTSSNGINGVNPYKGLPPDSFILH